MFWAILIFSRAVVDHAPQFCCSAYGSTKRYKSMERIFKVNDSTVVAASGEISDFQYIQVHGVHGGG
jgi:hypothetical protein